MNFLQRSRRRLMVKREGLWTERVNYATVSSDDYACNSSLQYYLQIEYLTLA